MHVLASYYRMIRLKSAARIHVTLSAIRAPNISLPVYIKIQPMNIDSRYFLAIAIAFDSLTYDVREGDKKAIVGISVASGEITSPLTMK